MTPQLRGSGYQKKGGKAATHAHNERVRETLALILDGPSTDPAPAVQSDPTPDAARRRASAGVSWPLIASAWIAGVGMGGTTVALLEAGLR